MTRKELQLVLLVLEKIRNPDSYVMEAIYKIKGDIERYDKMSKENRKNNRDGYDYSW